MKRQNSIVFILCALGMLILILDGQTALFGAREGIRLCLWTLLPSLFPYIVLSVMMTDTLTGRPYPILRPLGKLCRFPEGFEFLLLLGFLGGYPVGAQNVAMQYRRGRISRYDAQRLLPLCNHPGPAFLFGILGTVFQNPLIPWLIWLILILSALIAAVLIPGNPKQAAPPTKEPSLTLPQALRRSLSIMAGVCGWVVLFRMMTEFLSRWFLWALPAPAQVILSGLLELSNGAVSLSSIEGEPVRFLAALMILSLGGLCVTMQTATICEGLSLKLYFLGKAFQCTVAILLGGLVLPFVFGSGSSRIPSTLLLIDGLFCLILFLSFRRTQNNSSILLAHGV